MRRSDGPVLLLLVLGLAGCAGASAGLAGEVSYKKDAKGNFELGQRELEGHNYTDAAQYFQYTKNKFPYSHYASLAELRLADSNFDQEKFTEAIDGYKNFIKDHPTHAKVDYAGFRIGLSHYKDIPSDFFLLPPSYEKDQQQLSDAQLSLKDFLASYPASSYVPEAKKLLADVRKRLARHELYVGQYYEQHGHPKAAAWRYEGLAQDYGDTPYASEAKDRADRLFAKLGNSERRHKAPPADSSKSTPLQDPWPSPLPDPTPHQLPKPPLF